MARAPSTPWASGNGGNNGDDCGADGYVGSIHTISVGSINDMGESVYFMEKCASTMAVVRVLAVWRNQ